MIRFHLDQNVDSAIARGLRLRGIDVTTTAEAGLQDYSDDEQLAYALASERVIFSHDRDMLRLHSAGTKHAGMVYSKQGSRSIGEIIRFLELMALCVEAGEIRGRHQYF